MQTRSLPIEMFNRQIVGWMMEGMEETINGDSGILYKTLANDRMLENPADLIGTFSGGGMYALHGEFEVAKMFEPGNGYKIGFNPLYFKSSFRIPGTLREFPATQNFVAKWQRILGGYGIQTLDQLFVNMLNNGFNAAFPTYDGLPLFSIAHPLRNAGGTFANRPTVGSALSEQTLADALTYFLDMPNDDGMRFAMTPRYLLVPPSLQLFAEQLLGSLSPATAPNANLRSRVAGKLEIIVSPKLTSATAWFVLASPSALDSSGHGLDLWFTPQGLPKTDFVESKDPKYVKYIGEFRVAPIITKVRGVFGNPGV